MAEVQEFERRCFELADLKSAMAALGWDQETMMPVRGAGLRARQLSTLAGLYHERLTDPDLGTVTGEMLESASTEWERRSAHELKREIDKAVRVPRALVEELTQTASLAYHAWVEARRADDFEAFAPWLRKVFHLKREEARCRSDGDYYETLLDDYEPALPVEDLERILAAVQPRLSRLLERIVAANREIPRLEGTFSPEGQERFGRRVLTAMGFDWEAGRLDRSPHPFCSGFNPSDVRITTRYSKRDVTSALFGMIHEAGHGLYEQGLPADRFGWPACEAISLGIHESQSRLWENQIGRSRAFWSFWLPELQGAFPKALADWRLDDFVLAVNRVEPSLIRVEADEVTYGLHVILRFEIERALLDEQVDVADLPRLWNDKMEQYLGIRPPDDASGVLQDTHWSQGLIGYFPTYLLGNLYAAQLLEAARSALPGLETLIAEGQFEPLRRWLGQQVHAVGRTRTAAELVEAVTGQPLEPEFFLTYLEEKFGGLYALD